MRDDLNRLRKLTYDDKIKEMAEENNREKVKKLQDAPTRLLKEVDIIEIQDRLCPSCRAHCEGFVHLTSGRGGQHLNNDIEISELIREIKVYSDSIISDRVLPRVKWS